MSFHSRGLLSAGPSKKRKEPPKAGEPPSSNRLLAGFMAYEFLTKGTLLGREFDPNGGDIRTAAAIASSSSAQPKRPKPKAETEPRTQHHQNYSELATILKTDGAHISGIVNPTQLGRWLQK